MYHQDLELFYDHSIMAQQTTNKKSGIFGVGGGTLNLLTLQCGVQCYVHVPVLQIRLDSSRLLNSATPTFFGSDHMLRRLGYLEMYANQYTISCQFYEYISWTMSVGFEMPPRDSEERVSIYGAAQIRNIELETSRARQTVVEAAGIRGCGACSDSECIYTIKSNLMTDR